MFLDEAAEPAYEIFASDNGAGVGLWGEPSGLTAVAWSATSKTRPEWQAATAVAITPRGDQLAVALQLGEEDERWVIDIVSTKDWQPVCRQLEIPGRVNELHFDDTGSILASASSAGDAQLWDTKSCAPASEPLPHGGPGGRTLVGRALASSDGRRAVTIASSEDTWNRDGRKSVEHIYLWNVLRPGTSERVPEWFLSWAERLGGARLDARGLLVRLDEPVTAPKEAGNANDVFGQVAHWMHEGGLARPASPLSTASVSDAIDDRLLENYRDAIGEAYAALPGDELVLSAEAERAMRESTLSDEAERARAQARLYAELATARLKSPDHKPSDRRDARVHSLLARAWYGLGDIRRARAEATTAASLDSERPEYARLSSAIARAAAQPNYTARAEGAMVPSVLVPLDDEASDLPKGQ
jgi:hypothetical protein